jgi:hypothetical protein
MDKEERSAMRILLVWFFGLIISLMLLTGAATVVSRAFDLAWFPWQVKMQTGMIRNSNSYITTQQSALRQMRSDYEDAQSDGQRAAIVRQMHQIADLIPNDTQPDIRAFLGSH